MKLALLILFVFSAAVFVFGLGPLLVAIACVALACHLGTRWVLMVPLLLALSMPAPGRADELDDLPACQTEECDYASHPEAP